ncbi:MAG: signal peptidase I [Bacilli bacterium]|nr:signal peptidase I [Bacilli bacterium]
MYYEFIEFLKDALKYIVIIAIIILLRIFVLTTTEITGPSMEPNLYEKNIVLVDQLTKNFNGLNRFNVVVIKRSTSYVVKRIIGLPGEKIKYKDNNLYINGEILKDTDKLMGITSNFNEITIPENEYYVMGDNREDSTDSRVFGTITKKSIVGEPFLTVWPLNKIKIVK